MGRSQPSLYFLLLLLFVNLLPFPTSADLNNGTIIALGSTLIASDGTKRWLSSPSGDFAFGFSHLKGTNQFLLGIWYANLNDDHTIVWNAETGSPVPPGSTLRLSVDGLILLGPESNNTLRRIGVGKAKQGILYDTGKFAILGSGSAVLWDTFSHPTNTLLPTQSLEMGTMLISRKENALMTPGRFYLQMLESGNLVLSTKSVPTNSDYDAEYYNSQTAAGSGYKLIFSEKGSISVVKRDNTSVLDLFVPLSSSIVLENYLRLTLNFDGVLGLYRYPKVSTSGNRSWIPLWTQPDNICTRITGSKGSGACGYNNVCSLDTTTNRPSCKCPPGYSLIDPSDKYGNCKPDFVPTCDGSSSNNSSSYGQLIEVKDTDWPLSDFEQISPSSKEGCREACLEDCFCSVAIYRSNSCWKKKLPLSNGRIDTSLGATAFLKVREGSDVPPSSSKHG
ncbi:unnamed protein product [Cuscuta campestris]|uniref:Bulb-type lectin domain-containing protein n=1 Tax=Cuscuta campestris TaxID=132261 RepID=A0A484N257_9ASTE|nr:unnamed protein product [Cuscuta campestris]